MSGIPYTGIGLAINYLNPERGRKHLENVFSNIVQNMSN